MIQRQRSVKDGRDIKHGQLLSILRTVSKTFNGLTGAYTYLLWSLGMMLIEGRHFAARPWAGT